jgi:nicotinamide-nucleotide amidase
MTEPAAPGLDQARRLHELLLARGETLAVAESLTGGALGAALTAVPGVSATFRGGVVAYATDLKAALLGVDAGLLAERGPVDADVAAAMAAGARARLGATYGLATTGVAGPDPQAGHPPGEVHLAVAGPGGTRRERLQLAGDRGAVRAATVRRALLLAAEVVSAEAAEAGAGGAAGEAGEADG